MILIDDSGFAKNACPELADYVPEIPESTCIILTEAEVDKRGRLYKAIKTHGRIVEFKRQDEKTLARWVLGMLKREEKQITEETLRAFLGRTGSDMPNIQRELETVSSAAAVKRTGSGSTGPGGDSKESRHSALCSWKIPGAGKKIYQSAASSGSRRLCEYGRTGEDRTDR